MNIGGIWKEKLMHEGYEHHIRTREDCEKLGRFSRIWRRILRRLSLSAGNGLRVFEFRCGGGRQLVPFALNSWQCVGIDVSPGVLQRAEAYVREASDVCGAKLNVEFICSDFLTYTFSSDKQFDVVFHVGVLEHFIDDAERLVALRKMFNLVRVGGYVISIVPSGTHPFRNRVKSLQLGGYDVPEIDYTPNLMREEFMRCGAVDITILPHDLFGYVPDDTTVSKPLFMLKKSLYYVLQIVPPAFFPRTFVFNHSAALIGIVCKNA